MSLLSLDLADAFQNELGISHFFNNTLKQTARESLSELHADESFDAWFISSSGNCDIFLDNVAKKLGNASLSKLINWMNDAYESAVGVCELRATEGLLEDLIAEWNEDIRREILPVNKPLQANVRLLIADYIAHNDNLYSEIERTSGIMDSSWDNIIDERREVPDWSITEVWVRSYNLSNVALWEHIGKSMSNDEYSKLIKWMIERAHIKGVTWHPPIEITLE